MKQPRRRIPRRNLPQVVISYRRSDSLGSAGRLADGLAARLGKENVFFDVEAIPAGVDFRDYIRDAVEGCDVLLVVIGPGWLMASDELGRPRLHSPDDFVRLEIEYALDANKRVIPVLVEGAFIPRELDLPETIARLSYRQAEELTHAHWPQDLNRVVDRLILPRPRRFGRWGDIKRLAPARSLAANALWRPWWLNVVVPLSVAFVGIAFHHWWLVPVALGIYAVFVAITLFDLEEARQLHGRKRTGRAGEPRSLDALDGSSI